MMMRYSYFEKCNNDNFDAQVKKVHFSFVQNNNKRSRPFDLKDV